MTELESQLRDTAQGWSFIPGMSEVRSRLLPTPYPHTQSISQGPLLCLCFCRGSPCLPPKGVQACRSLQLHPSAQWTVKWSWQRCWLRADERANEGLHQEGNFPHLHYYMWKCHSDQSSKCSGGKGNIMTETIWHPI